MNTHRYATHILHSIMLIFVGTAAAAPTYSIATLGFDDIEHTRIDGHRYSLAEYLNESGQVVGYSRRYNGGVVDLGRSVWLYDGTTTLGIGLAGPEFSSSDGYKTSFATALNQLGQVIGSSALRRGRRLSRLQPWYYNGTTTGEVGLIGPEHTRADGYRSSSARLDGAGHVSGSSLRYGGSSDLGQSVWIYGGSGTIEIGFTEPDYTRGDGYRYSFFSSVDSSNAGGQFIGYSSRYNGNVGMGGSAWLYNGVSTIDIGLTGPEHTRSDGFRESFVDQLNESGQVIGTSIRYNGGSTSLGRTAWFFDGLTTVDIGLAGPGYTNSRGNQSHRLEELNDAGYVIGSSTKFSDIYGATDSLWIYHNATTVEIGLTGPETHRVSWRGSQSVFYQSPNERRGASHRDVRPIRQRRNPCRRQRLAL